MKYTGSYTKDSSVEFYTLLIRNDKDGQTQVAYGYKGRYFKSIESAKKSIEKHIKKHNLN